MIKLERCPFCGSLAGYSRVPGQGFSVVCRGCGAIAMHELTQERDDVARAWNLRAPQAAPAASANRDSSARLLASSSNACASRLAALLALASADLSSA